MPSTSADRAAGSGRVTGPSAHRSRPAATRRATPDRRTTTPRAPRPRYSHRARERRSCRRTTAMRRLQVPERSARRASPSASSSPGATTARGKAAGPDLFASRVRFLAILQVVLGCTNELHDRDVGRAREGAAATFHAVEDVVVFHLVEHARLGKPCQTRRVQEIGACLEASAAANARVLLAAHRLFFREDEYTRTALEHGDVETRDGPAHHRPAHDDLAGSRLEAAAELDDVTHGCAERHYKVRGV